MTPITITNAHLHFTKQLLAEFELKSLKFDEMYVKQMLYSQFKQLLHALILEVGFHYKLTNLNGDFSIDDSLNNLLAQCEDMAELQIIKNLKESDESNFINKVLEFKMGVDVKTTSDSIFKTTNTENEIFSEMQNLIQSIREMTVQQ